MNYLQNRNRLIDTCTLFNTIFFFARSYSSKTGPLPSENSQAGSRQKCRQLVTV